MQDIGWDEKWICDPTDGGCGVTHQRDDCAAINLARYEEPVSVVGPVGAAVKRAADPRPGLAGQVAIKRGRQPATRPANNPEMGCESRDHYRPLTRNGIRMVEYIRVINYFRRPRRCAVDDEQTDVAHRAI
ncbi:Putative methyltransferase/methylase [Mycobacterium canettii CIPT 140070010]|nr:Putative methyltransferase/methylase [Mycobacterium canettii CIPT 140070010]